MSANYEVAASGGGAHPDLATHDALGLATEAELDAAISGLSATYVAVADLTASGKGFVNHGATAGTARPTGYASIEWFGTVEPTNWVDGDTWNDPS